MRRSGGGRIVLGERGFKRLAARTGDDVDAFEIIGTERPFITVTDEPWQEAINENLFPAVRPDRGLLPSMIQRGSGVIIDESSIQRRLPSYDSTLAYAAARAALTNYSKALSNEVSARKAFGSI